MLLMPRLLRRSLIFDAAPYAAMPSLMRYCYIRCLDYAFRRLHAAADITPLLLIDVYRRRLSFAYAAAFHYALLFIRYAIDATCRFRYFSMPIVAADYAMMPSLFMPPRHAAIRCFRRYACCLMITTLIAFHCRATCRHAAAMFCYYASLMLLLPLRQHILRYAIIYAADMSLPPCRYAYVDFRYFCL